MADDRDVKGAVAVDSKTKSFAASTKKPCQDSKKAYLYRHCLACQTSDRYRDHMIVYVFMWFTRNIIGALV